MSIDTHDSGEYCGSRDSACTVRVGSNECSSQSVGLQSGQGRYFSDHRRKADYDTSQAVSMCNRLCSWDPGSDKSTRIVEFSTERVPAGPATMIPTAVRMSLFPELITASEETSPAR